MYINRYEIKKRVRRLLKIFIPICSFVLFIYLLRKPMGDFTKNLTEELMCKYINSTYQEAMVNSSGFVTYVDRLIKHKDNYLSGQFLSQFVINQYVEEQQPLLFAKNNFDNQMSDINFNYGLLSEDFLLSNGTVISDILYNNEQQYVQEHFNNENQIGYDRQELVTESEPVISEHMELEIGVIDGEIQKYDFSFNPMVTNDNSLTTLAGNVFTYDMLFDTKFLLNNFYIIDPGVGEINHLMKAQEYMEKDMTIKQTQEEPQILIYHTHSLESFSDSREGVVADSVVGIGSYLAEILTKEYGYNVIHDMSCYDIVNGIEDRNAAYDIARKGVERNLKKYPSIEVIIDLHRDGVEARTTTIDGKRTARIMLFNGVSQNKNGRIEYLSNQNLESNLSFSLQLQLESLTEYPGLFYRNYINCYRYNMDLRPKSLLIELGTYKNSLQEARNAVRPFAQILDSVLQGKDKLNSSKYVE